MRKIAFFREMLEQRVVERLRRFAIAAERLLDDEARVDVEPALGERGNDHAKQAGGNCQIVQRPLGAAERLLQFCEGLRIVVVAIDISQEPQQLIEFRGVGAPVLFDAVLGPALELFDCPAGLGDADDRHVDAFVADKTEKRREDLLEGEIAGSAEEHQGVGLGGLHLISCGVEIRKFGRSSTRRLAAHSNHTLMDMAN